MSNLVRELLRQLDSMAYMNVVNVPDEFNITDVYLRVEQNLCGRAYRVFPVDGKLMKLKR